MKRIRKFFYVSKNFILSTSICSFIASFIDIDPIIELKFAIDLNIFQIVCLLSLFILLFVLLIKALFHFFRHFGIDLSNTTFKEVKS